MGNISRLASITAYENQAKYFSTVVNNLSNAHTPGFKRDLPLFRSLLDRNMGQNMEAIPFGLIKETRTVFQQGDLRQTRNALDLAIEGEGFFKLKTPYGFRYTRSGNFKLNQEGVLTDSSDFPVMGKKGEIVLKGQTITVNRDGMVDVDGNQVDQVAVAAFSDLGLLKKDGQNHFRLEDPQEEKESQDSRVLQGTLEASNVNPFEEMVKLIDSLRTYESCLKMIQSQDEMDSKAANDVGRV